MIPNYLGIEFQKQVPNSSIKHRYEKELFDQNILNFSSSYFHGYRGSSRAQVPFSCESYHYPRVLSAGEYDKPKEDDDKEPIKEIDKITISWDLYLKFSKIFEVFDSQFAITNDFDINPILATYGLLDSIAVAGYDRINKIAFLIHFSNEQEVYQCGREITNRIMKFAKKKIDHAVEIHLRGGRKSLGTSENILNAIHKWMKIESSYPMEIRFENTVLLTDNEKNRSFFIDVRDGSTGFYDPIRNPNRRNKTELEIRESYLRLYRKDVKLVYEPQENENEKGM